MVFEISYTQRAALALQELRAASQIFLRNMIDALANDPEAQGQISATPYSRYRQLNHAGQYQVTYTINRKLNKVTIVSIRTVFP